MEIPLIKTAVADYGGVKGVNNGVEADKKQGTEDNVRISEATSTTKSAEEQVTSSKSSQSRRRNRCRNKTQKPKIDHKNARPQLQNQHQHDHNNKQNSQGASSCDCPFIQIHRVSCKLQKPPGLNHDSVTRSHFKAIMKQKPRIPRMFDPRTDKLTEADLILPLYPMFYTGQLFIAVPRVNPPETLLVPGTWVQIVKHLNPATAKLELKWEWNQHSMETST